MKLTHFEKQTKRMELKKEGFSPTEVEKKLKEILNPKIMEEEKVEIPIEETIPVSDVPEEEERDQPEVENPLPEEEEII